MIFSKWWILTGSNRRPPACKTGALPAELRTRYYTRLVPRAGIEPARYNIPQDFKSCASTYSATQAYGVPETIRTSDPLIKSQLLYRLSYGDVFFLVPAAGLEPATY